MKICKINDKKPYLICNNVNRKYVDMNRRFTGAEDIKTNYMG